MWVTVFPKFQSTALTDISLSQRPEWQAPRKGYDHVSQPTRCGCPDLEVQSSPVPALVRDHHRHNRGSYVSLSDYWPSESCERDARY